jgi:error-prone DNA polymerase
MVCRSPRRSAKAAARANIIWVENPTFADLPFTGEQLQSMAQAFKLAVGSRLVFADGTPDIVVYPSQSRRLGPTLPAAQPGQSEGRVKGDCILHLDDLLNGCARPAADRHAGQAP